MIEDFKNYQENKKISDCMLKVWREEVIAEDYLADTHANMSRFAEVYKKWFNSDAEKWRSYCRTIAQSDKLMGRSGDGGINMNIKSAIHEKWYKKIMAGWYSSILQKTPEVPIPKNHTLEDVYTMMETTEGFKELPEDAKRKLESLARYVGYEYYKAWIPKCKITQEKDSVLITPSSSFVESYIQSRFGSFMDILGIRCIRFG